VGGERETLAGTAIVRRGQAVLLRGRSGCGKSDLALRCLAQPLRLPGEDAAYCFDLISDDQCAGRRDTETGRVLLTAPPAIAGLLEVRGLGVVQIDALARAPLALVADLQSADIPRMADLDAQRTNVLGVPVPLIQLMPFEVSAPAKLAIVLRDLAGTY